MTQSKPFIWNRWLAEKQRQRGQRALERQLDYQKKKAANLHGQEKNILLNLTIRAQSIRQKLEKIKPVSDDSRILEVGSGAHGLVFGFENKFAIGIDPLAVDYKRLFPTWQKNTKTIAAVGEELPFDDGSFDVVLSDNVIDHAENPVKIIEELTRVLKSGGLLYFTVNVHHPVYNAASKAHGFWNALGIKFELSPFADHTVHFTENRIRQVFSRLPFKIIEENSTIRQAKAEYNNLKSPNLEQRIKKVFFKNALYEILAVRQ